MEKIDLAKVGTFARLQGEKNSPDSIEGMNGWSHGDDSHKLCGKTRLRVIGGHVPVHLNAPWLDCRAAPISLTDQPDFTGAPLRLRLQERQQMRSQT